MPVWDAILLGLVQGLTEFLPISSTAHLVLLRRWLGHPNPDDAFAVVIQLGTLVAVFAYFRGDVAKLIRGFVGDLRARKIGTTPDGRMAWLIGVGSVPAGLAGLFLKKWLHDHFYNPTAIAWVAIGFALVMAAAELWAHARRNVANPGRGEADIGWFDAVWVGVWQALALMPGASRSGCTISGGLFAGLSRPAAARFSFLLSMPIMLAAGVKETWSERTTLLASSDDAVSLAVGLAVAAVVGYASIAWLLHFLKRYSMGVFVMYRIGLGVGILVMIAMGKLS
jgi:undecaprenyl-diphosphatase